MVIVEWSNGKVDHARTWEALETKVRNTQMREYTEEEFRLAMETRALRWSKTEIDPWLPAGKFFTELERAHLLVIIDDTEEKGRK